MRPLKENKSFMYLLLSSSGFPFPLSVRSYPTPHQCLPPNVFVMRGYRVSCTVYNSNVIVYKSLSVKNMNGDRKEKTEYGMRGHLHFLKAGANWSSLFSLYHCFNLSNFERNITRAVQEPVPWCFLVMFCFPDIQNQSSQLDKR